MNHLAKNLFLSLLCLFFFTSCSFINPPSKPLSRTEFILGTTVTLSLHDHQSEQLLDKAFNRITELENTLSVNKVGTLIDTINDAAGKSAVQVDPDTFNVIQKGLAYSALTDGYFDITVGPIVKLWHIGFPDARVPSKEEIQEKLPLINYHNVILDASQQTVFLKESGMMLDLGGIGKGYAADEICSLLKSEGVTRAIIDLGGNLYMLGDKSQDTPWTVGVQDPFNPRGDIIGHLNTANQSVVTSGIYERFIEQNGIQYHHILNPKTGYPFTNEIAGVTIVSDYSTDGDALSTAVFAKGLKEGMAFIESLNAIEAIFITKDYKVYTSSGLKNNFVLTSPDFTIYNNIDLK